MGVTWAPFRMQLACLMQSGISPDNMHKVSGLGGYQSFLKLAALQVCKIGYCPMIEGPFTDFTTVCTVWKHAEMVSDVFEQHDAVITFDVAFYIQKVQIQRKFPEVFSNNGACLEGFHIALNDLSLLGKKLRFIVSALGNISVYSLAIFISLSIFNAFQ